MTKVSDWRYIPSEINPADIASRGMYPHETEKLENWLNGPKFLNNDREMWPESKSGIHVDTDNIEIKSKHCANMIQRQDYGNLEDMFHRFSDWHKLQRAVAWLLRFKEFMCSKYNCGKNVVSVQTGNLTVTEIHRATGNILSRVQQKVYGEEMYSLGKLGRVSRCSQLFKLSPILSEGMLIVGGRLSYANVPDHCKHPIILPGNNHVTMLIIRKNHETNAHMGAQHILALTRQKYWIVRGLKNVKSVLDKCLNCKRRQKRPETQQMAPLPYERLTPDKPPFTFVGVDYFGPMYVKCGRTERKHYGCLFTCLTTRAVHIEIAHSLDTDSFMCAIQRFISRRGRPSKMFSDNGTNLTSGERELRESIMQWNQSRIARNLQQREIAWHFNPPYASHMGGVWERLIRSVKHAMKSVVKEQLLNDEALLTLAAETEKIINDRPITQVSSDSRDPEPLSPSKLLLLSSNSCLPLGVFDKSDNYCKRWWRQVQYLANVFWRRWTKEYIPSLQPRHKWQEGKNVTVSDLVLVCDENLPRGKWPLGLVLEVTEGRDGLVRSCRVRVNGTEKVRPITKLCVLEQNTA